MKLIINAPTSIAQSLLPRAAITPAAPVFALNAYFSRAASISMLTVAALLTACGGGSTEATDTSATATDEATAPLGSTSSTSTPTSTTASTGGTAASTTAAATGSTTWAVCASERQTCSFTGTRSVRYGTATKYVTATFTNGVACGNASFGDPAYGETKTCWIGGTSTTTAPSTTTPTTTPSTSTSGSSWTQCAIEQQNCSFTGTRAVRYGTSSQYVTATFTNGVACTNAVFGDPAVGQTKTCWYNGTTTSTTTSTTPVVTAPSITAPSTTAPSSTAPSVSGGAGPSVTSFTSSGPITARSGQVIERVRVTSSSGSCITIPSGVTNVTIRDSEIGPCGQPGDTGAKGIDVQSGASNITVQRNYIHDMATALYASGARHPIIFDRNRVTNIRGPFPRGQMVQFNGVNSGTSGSKVTCNVSDVQGAAYRNVEDHINMYDSAGLSNDRTEIAYNRLRGGHPTSNSGTAIMVGDGASGGNIWVHHNTAVNVRNVGIGVAGGTNIAVESNRVYMDRAATYTNVGLYVWSQGGGACSNHSVKGNRAWVNSSSGAQNPWWNGGNCGAIDMSGNTWGDTTLSASIFDEVPSQCQ